MKFYALISLLAFATTTSMAEQKPDTGKKTETRFLGGLLNSALGGLGQSGHHHGGGLLGGLQQGGGLLGGFQQGGFPQGGFQQGGFPQGGFQQGGFPQGGFHQGGFQQGGIHGGIGGAGVGGSSSACRYWCRTPQGQAYCCENTNQAQSFVGVKPGQCPPRRPVCPSTRFGPPASCSNDGSCAGIDKCCFDTCLQQHVCKAPYGVGR